MSGGKIRIYEYWQENHSKQEKTEFLKNEYGTGGHSHAISGTSGSGEDHDAKGIRYTKDGCEQVQLSWTQVVSRIDTLIQNERYLNVQEKENLESHREQAFQQLNLYNQYNDIKEKRPDDMVLCQVGDFFELYGEDAKNAAQELDIVLTTKEVPDIGRVPMCGVPANQLEQCLGKLRENHGVAILAIPDDGTEYREYRMRDIYQNIQREADLPSENAPESDLESEALKEKLESRGIVDGEVIDQEKLDHDPFIQQVLADAENIANEDISDWDERFSILPVESGGYVVWDNLKDNLYVNEDGYGEQQVTLEEAQEYLEEQLLQKKLLSGNILNTLNLKQVWRLLIRWAILSI